MSSHAISELQKLRQQPSRQSLAAVRRMSQLFASAPSITTSSTTDDRSLDTTSSANLSATPSFSFAADIMSSTPVNTSLAITHLRSAYQLMAELLSEQMELRAVLATRSPAGVNNGDRLSGALQELETTVNKLVATRSELEASKKQINEITSKYENLQAKYLVLQKDFDALSSATELRNVTESPMPPQSPPPEEPTPESIVVTIDLGSSSSPITITHTTNPYETAFAFLSTHQLSAQYLEPLVQYIKEAKASLVELPAITDVTASPPQTTASSPLKSSPRSPDISSTTSAIAAQKPLNAESLRRLIDEHGITDVSGLLALMTASASSSAASPPSAASQSPVVTSLRTSTVSTSTPPPSPSPSIHSTVQSPTQSSFISSSSSSSIASSCQNSLDSPLAVNVSTAQHKTNSTDRVSGQLSLRQPALSSLTSQWNKVDCYLDNTNSTLTCCTSTKQSYSIVGVVSLQNTLAAPIITDVSYSFSIAATGSTLSVVEGFENFNINSDDSSCKELVFSCDTLSEMISWINSINKISGDNCRDSQSPVHSRGSNSNSVNSSKREHLSFSISDSCHTKSTLTDSTMTSCVASARENTRYGNSSPSYSSPNKTLTLDQLSPSPSAATATPTRTPLSRDNSQHSLLSSLSSNSSTPRQQQLQQAMTSLPTPSPVELAVEIYDSATTLANAGDVDDAVPLFLHALKTFEEYELPELAAIREEVWGWISTLPQYNNLLESSSVNTKSFPVDRRSNRGVDLL